MEHLLTRREAAEALRKPESWLRYAERRRVVPFVKVGRCIRYLATDIAAFVARGRVAASGEALPTESAP